MAVAGAVVLASPECGISEACRRFENRCWDRGLVADLVHGLSVLLMKQTISIRQGPAALCLGDNGVLSCSSLQSPLRYKS